MTVTETSIPGCVELRYPVHADERGVFVKTFQSSLFEGRFLENAFVETFYTVSGENVLRGMHVQSGPAEQAKLVYCLGGAVMDVALDLRFGSPTYGRFAVIELSAEDRNAVYLPPGVAHGFYVRRGPAMMMYHVTSEYAAAHDTGIRWDSFGAPWPAASPVISERDRSLVTLAEFNSPFQFAARSQSLRMAL